MTPPLALAPLAGSVLIMPKLKETHRSATVAWSPIAANRNFICAGTVAGAIDDSFAAGATLEVLEVEYAAPGMDLAVRGTIECSERFNKLAWSKIGTDSQFPLGLVAGGMVDGRVNIWNPAALCKCDSPAFCASSRQPPPVTHP